jgi:arylsulfatase A-like enzyme
MKTLGYRTALVGKWHLGYQPEFHPMKRGFDEFFGFLGGAHSYTDPLGDASNPVMRGTERIDEKEYLTDALAREAVSFIDRQRNDPFFLYLAFNAVHTPMQATNKYLDRFANIGDRNRRIHAGMMSAMDDAIGGVLSALSRNKLMEDTLIFFISDNGGPTPSNTSRNTPLRGFKGQVLEGGIRVPFIMQWNGRIPKGTVNDSPAIALDVLPTAIAAGGGKAEASWKLDGVDLMPFASGKNKGRPHESLYWRFGAQAAVRRGDWKLVWQNRQEAPELYHLSADIGEARNQAEAEPAKLAELKADWDQWNSRNIEPKWRTTRDGRGKKQGKKKA